tara:strand:+ start:76739 stop:77221 length:483 start_codon:yes stop_codon:yes gene_type:complete
MFNRLIDSKLLQFGLLACVLLASPMLQAETKEQKVRISVTEPADGKQCEVKAAFGGDHDNCSNKKAGGRADCAADTGCVCTRQEKHITWVMEGKDAFNIVFDQGNKNPFVKEGSSECNFKSNKKGKLRCRVKGKDTPRGMYNYTIDVAHCKPLTTRVKIY